ncbi:hypothetical protein [Priestia flexa]|uniref:hypothetical protein n=1 Tax=Priestia flexa TaxID=86664 RepID=UPI001CFE7C61|nr:hypothetical protein [Priestia flexa]
MEQLLTLADLVEEYGTNVQKQSFEKKGNINRRSFDSIIKKVEQTWESVIIEGRGSKRIIKCIGKREVEAIKKDGRVRSGRQQIEHRIPMDIIVATYLEFNMTERASMSLGKWAVELGLITPLEYDLLRSRHNSKMRKKHIDMVVGYGILEEDQLKVLDEFTQYCLGIYGQLAKSLEHMKKCGIIVFYEQWKGYAENGKLDINPEVMKGILKERKNLMKKHGVVEFNLSAHQNARKVKSFNSEWKEVLAKVKDESGNILGIKYYWKEYVVISKATSKAIQLYLETYCADALESYFNKKDLFICESEADYLLKRRANIMKKIEKRHRQKLQEYKQQKINFSTEEEEKLIRLFYTQQELEDILTVYDLGIKRLHLQNLYVERMTKLFDLYNIKDYKNKNHFKEALY